MDRTFDDAARTLDHSMDAWEFYRVLAPVVAAIHCGHSRIELPDTLNQELNARRSLLPMQVRIIGGRVWVFRDLSDDGGIEGREIVAINGVPAHRLLETLYRAMPSDGFGETQHPAQLRGFRFAGMLERVFGFDGLYDVVLRDPHGGRDRHRSLTGATVPALSARLQARYPGDATSGPNGEFELLDDGRVARLKLRGFFGTVDDSGKIDVRSFLRQSFQSLADHDTRSLIVDLRDNGGGEDALGKILLSYFVDGPFRYYDDLVLNARGFSFSNDSIPSELVEKRADGKYHMVGHPNWGMQQPGAPHFAGRLYVLMNGGSFSTTCEFLSHVRDLRRGTLIGEESGGAYVGNTSGGVARVVLPHSLIQIGVPLTRYDLAVAPERPFGRGVRPDVPIVPGLDDLMAGRDVVLAKALEMARAEVSTPGR